MITRLLDSLTRRRRERRAAREARLVQQAIERHARVFERPGHEFGRRAARLDRLRFLRREHMFLDWTSWNAALRDD